MEHTSGCVSFITLARTFPFPLTKDDVPDMRCFVHSRCRSLVTTVIFTYGLLLLHFRSLSVSRATLPRLYLP